MPRMTYVFGVLATGQILDELPLTSVRMTRTLNVAGQMTATLSLDMSGRSNADVVAATTPGQCFCIAEREGVPIWGGPITAAVYQSQAKVYELTAMTFEKYPDRRIIEHAITDTDDQRNLFRTLWLDLQAQSYSNLGVTIPGAFSPTVTTKTLEITGTERKKYASAMEALADADDGFDWTIDIAKNADGTYAKILRIGNPLIGNQDPTLLQFEYPGSILNYYATNVMGPSGTHITVIGNGEGSVMLTSQYVHQDLLDTGQWLRWDFDVSAKDLTTQTDVAGRAGVEGPKRKPPSTVIKAFLKGDLEPQFASYGLGDACTLVITDPRYPNTLQVPTRVVAYAYKPAESDNTEEVELIFAGDELNNE